MPETVETSHSHGKAALKLVAVAIGMFGFGFALVPIYDLFCEVTGLNGKIEQSATLQYVEGDVSDRTVYLSFPVHNNSVKASLEAEVIRQEVPVGSPQEARFVLTNMTDKVVDLRAIPSVIPGLAAEHFRKTDCFCWNAMQLQPHEQRTEIVRFVIDPQLEERYLDIAMGYTLFDAVKDDRISKNNQN